MSKLTEKQKAFADYYIESLNATESYKKAYGLKNIKSCEARGSALLSNIKVSEYISNRLEEAKTSRIVTITNIMEFWSDAVNNDYKKLGYDEPLNFKDRHIASESLAKRLELASNLDIKKKEVDIEYLKAKVELLKGSKKDTSLLDALIGVIKE